MAEPSDDDLLREDIARMVAVLVGGAFQSREQIWEAVEGMLVDASDPKPMRVFLRAELDRLWGAQRAKEATWKGVTDCDRLDRAFAELEETGIVCRQDFSCCGTCGVGEIADVCADLAAKGAKPRGYAFYHTQDTEGAVEGEGIYLNYGDLEDNEDASLDVAREIVAVLKTHGLKVKWDGSWSQRIHVPLQWRRRFVCA